MQIQILLSFAALTIAQNSSQPDGSVVTGFTGNATGQLTLPAPYVSLLDKTPSDSYGFRFALNITADAPDRDNRQVNKFVTNTGVFLLPPTANTSLEMLNGWQACWLNMAGAKLQSTSNDYNENCAGIVPDKCLLALQAEVMGGGQACPDPFAPQECDGVFDFETGVNMNLTDPQLGEGMLANDALYGGHVAGKAYNHDKGDKTVYNKAVKQIIVGRLAYVNEKSSSGGPKVDGTVRCLRVDKFSPGNETSAAPLVKLNVARGVLMSVLVFMVVL